MEDSRLVSEEIGRFKSKVESVSLTQIFEKLCPIYMSYGMSYDEYWFESPYRTQFYRKAKEISVRQKDEELWMQGVYIYDALCRVSPILHAFCKSGTKPLPYVEKPYLNSIDNNEITHEQQVENERLKAEVQFRTWARNVAKKFKKEETHD